MVEVQALKWLDSVINYSEVREKIAIINNEVRRLHQSGEAIVRLVYILIAYIFLFA